MIRAWHKGDKLDRTYSQESRNNSSAARELAEAIRRNLWLKGQEIKARKLRTTA